MVIGDPGKRAQNAHVFYSNNYIRLIHDDAIKKRFRFDYGVDSSCPVSQNFKFCGKIQVVLQNRGVPIFSQVNRKERPTFKKWNFSKDFTVDVRFTKDQTSNSLEQIFVWDGITECKFGPNIDTVETAIFLYGNISEFFGAKISIIAETNVSGNNEISLRESYKGKTVLAPLITKDYDFYIGSSVELSLAAEPKRSTVILGQESKIWSMKFSVHNLMGKNIRLLDGLLQIYLPISSIKLLRASSDPHNIVSCRQEGRFVTLIRYILEYLANRHT